MPAIRSLLYTLLLLFPVTAFSQSASEIQLRKELSAATSDSAKARISGQLAWDLKFIHNDEALKLVEDEIRLSHGDPLRLADANRTKGLILVTQNKPQEGLECYKLSIENARKAGDYYYEASCYSLTAGMYQDLGDYDRSLQYYLDGLKVAESGKNQRMIATILNNIATIYDASGRENEKALSYFSKALQQAKEQGDFAFAGMICSNMANEFVILKRKDSAEIMMKQAIEFSNRSGKKGYEYASSMRGVGEIYSLLDKPKEAEACLKEAVVLMDSLKRPLNVLNPISGLAELYLKQGRIADAQLMGDRLLKDATNYKAKLFIREAYKILSDVAHRKGQDALALEYLQQYNVWNDSIFNDTKEKSIANIQSRANLAQKELEVQYETQKKTQENSILKLRNNTLEIGVLSALVALILLAVMLFYIYRTNKQNEHINRDLAVKNKLIEQQSKEKDVLMLEIHHRVKNNLQIVSSLLNLQANSITDNAAKDALRESHNRVKSIALIHQKLYLQEDISAISLEEYVMQLCNHLKVVFNADQVEISCSVYPPHLKLGMEQSIPLGLILNELITNSIKYAQINKEGGQISIRFVDDLGGSCTLFFSDNGIGMPDNFDVTKATTLGMRMVNELTRQLNGTLVYIKTPSPTFKIVFPMGKI